MATEEFDVGLLVNNNGPENHGAFVGQDLSSETNLLQLNVVAPMQLTHHLTRKMQERSRGRIVFVSSAGG